MLMQRVEQFAIRGLAQLARRLGRGASLPEHLQIGLEGEQQALFYLRRQGFTVVARRWKSAKVRGDLDLIAWHGATLCFVEIKSRTARDALTAETAVNQSKRIQLRRLAHAYLHSFAEPERSGILTRFDILSIYLLPSGTEYEMLDNAFGWAEPNAARW